MEVPDDGDVAMIQRLRAVPTILRILCDMSGLRFGAVGRVTATRWIACAVLDRVGFGLAVGGELDVDTTFCRDVRRSKTALVIDQASADPLFDRSLVPKQYGFESYIAVPIVLTDGEVWGTICGFDPNPAALRGTPLLPMLETFAELLAGQIDNELRLAASVTALGDERALGVLREQFIAILGHDLRNPVAAIMSGISVLERDPPRERADAVLGHMRRSCNRAAGLIADTMDLARARLGGGISVDRRPTDGLAAELAQVIQEVQSVHHGTTIQTEMDLRGQVFCDSRRIGQLLSNLLSNALTHGAADRPVTVAAFARNGRLLLSVTNSGNQIPPDKMGNLFEPFDRAGSEGNVEGLGLGLYIASEIARSHDGILDATSSADATVFTFEMPVPDR